MVHPIINIATRAARTAGNIIVRAMDRLDKITVIEKSPNNFVTDIDRKVEKCIIDELKKAYPDYSILAEESDHVAGVDPDTIWIIDPLDGTHNFMHGIPHVAISIALQVKGKIEHGVIYDPFRDELYSATRGNGAQMNGRRLRVASQVTLNKALIATGIPNARKAALLSHYLTLFEKFSRQAAGIRRMGAAALDLAYVANGRFDGFWESGLAQWDMAAGALLVREAGGLVSDFQGGEDFLNTGNIVAANPKLLKLMLQNIL